MRACILIGVLATCTTWWAPAAAQLSNRPLYAPWPNAEPTYLPAPRYPTDSRNPTLDNRAPTLWPLAPDLRNAPPRFGSPLENGGSSDGARRADGLRVPGTAEPGRAAWR